MACTTLLVGRNASNDGSTLVARNEDCENGTFNAKSMVVVEPADQPRTYTGVASHLTMDLPDDPIRYTCVPNTDPSQGVWGEAGINVANVTMTATETISTNARVLGADPLVNYQPAVGKPGDADYQPEVPGGIGEENLVTIILPYIKSAREGVLRMGELLEKYGTYETNGVAFGDEKEIWYIETIGGHHWIARRVPDDCFVAQPNRLGIDHFDLHDAYGKGKDYLCSSDLAKWMAEHDLSVDTAKTKDLVDGVPAIFNPREAFSSYTWLDIVYNNPRAWYICKVLTQDFGAKEGPMDAYGPESMDIPWAMKPHAKISVMDVKNILSSTYDGTIYDPYGLQGTAESRSRFRDIGINRTCECSILQIRPSAPKAAQGVQWTAFGSGPFNTAIAMFTNVKSIPEYLDTPMEVSTDSFYWTNRLIAGLADPEYFDNMESISAYQQQTIADGYAAVKAIDDALAAKGGGDNMDDATVIEMLEKSNAELVQKVRKGNADLLSSVLFVRSLNMKNAFGASDH